MSVVIASILILGILGISYDSFAGQDDNNGNNGCVKSNPNSKACEKNPNTQCPNPSHLGFVFKGEITSISDSGNNLDGIIAVGETWSTLYCLDANTPDTVPGISTIGLYNIDFIAITIGDNDEFVCTDVQIVAIGNAASFDSYQVFCLGMTFPVLPPSTFSTFNIILTTTNTALFVDDSLPAFAPDLNDFENQALSWSNSFPFFSVIGTITSFVQVQ